MNPMTKNPPLSRGEVTRSLRAFIVAGGLWGAWGQMVGIGTSVFTGYALSLGADASFIPFVTSVASLTATIQILSSLIGTHVANKKRFLLIGGTVEILCRGVLVTIPMVFSPSLWLGALLILVSLGLVCGYLVSPFYSSWLATTIPENIRARFISRQTIVTSLVGMVTGFFVGEFIDYVDKQEGFTYVFVVGTLLGWLGYLILSRAPFPKTEQAGHSGGNFQLLFQPFKDENFRRVVSFYASWNFAVGLAGPLYSVFMLERLQISYATISIFNALFMTTMIIGYRVWAGFIDRFGSKPVLQILLAPSVLVPVLWIFNRPDAYALIPVALTLGGFVFSGISVSVTSLLYSLLPHEEEQKPIYLASWSTSVSLIAGLGPLVGGFLVRPLSEVHLEFFNTPIGNLQIVFFLSAVVLVVPNILLRSVVESRATSSRHLLSQIFQGNLLSYAYNATIYSLVTGEERRARAALAMGKSGNPLALDRLIHALTDASPKVRSHAARALGESRSEAAADSLIKELLKEDSDIRSEAAEALGRIGHPRSIDPLIEALNDHDLRVRISAIHGLSEIGGEEIQELLFWHFTDGFDPLTFPTLVDVLGGMEDRRIIKPTLQYLGTFNSPAIRLQLLNSVCRALGTEGEFYHLLYYEDTKRHSTLDRLLKRSESGLTLAKVFDRPTREALRDHFQ
ncbi:MAG: MFS transporter, partial [Candidatus Latescibacteria bacterium]|nr:MFS transporter [Candidatus Latescibacterota bacterium]